MSALDMKISMMPTADIGGVTGCVLVEARRDG